MIGRQSFPPLPIEDLQSILVRTSPLWEEARGKAFFITGGTGFFGMWLLESFLYINELLGLGARAVLLTRNPESFTAKAPHLQNKSNIRLIEGDVRDFALPHDTFDYIIHAATDISSSRPAETFDAITRGTERILELAILSKTRKLLLTSSGAVYGTQPPELNQVTEEYLGAPDPTDPNSAYGEGKRVAEHLASVHSRQYGYEVKIARCFSFVGPHLPLDSIFAIGNFIHDSLQEKSIRITGDGSPIRSYLYASDLAIWLWTLLFKAPSHRVYNVGSDDGLSIAQVADLVNRTLNGPRPIEISGSKDPRRLPSRYLPSVARAKQDLGLAPLVPLDQAILKTARWHQSRPIPSCNE